MAGVFDADQADARTGDEQFDWQPEGEQVGGLPAEQPHGAPR
jgi:hypothetical protein